MHLLVGLSHIPTASTAYAQGSTYADADKAYKNKDYKTAHGLWLGFAETGNQTSYFNLGRMYVFGHGVTIDMIEAYKWFKLADQAGLPQAKSGLNMVGRVMTPPDIIEGDRRVERWYDQHPRTRRE